MAFLSSNTIQPPHHDSLSYRDGAELVRMPAKNAVSEVLSTADRSKESVHKDPVLTYSTVRTPGEGKRLRNRIRKEVEKMKTRVQRGVKRNLPFKRLLRTVARPARVRAPLSVSSWSASTASITRNTITEAHSRRPYVGLRSPGDVARPRLSRSEPARVDDKAADRTATVDKLAAAISKGRTTERLMQIRSLIEQFHRQAEAYKTGSKNLASSRATSISAQMTAFRFSTLVSMDVLSRFAFTPRVTLILNNCLMARQDLTQLGRIWSQVVGSSPILWDLELNDPLHFLEEADAERLCRLLEKGLHCYSYWLLAAKASESNGEGAMGNVWWRNHEAKLNAVDSLNMEEISQQLCLLGWKYTNVPALECSIKTMKDAMADTPAETASIRHDSKTGLEEKGLKPRATVPEQGVFELEANDEVTAQHIKMSSADTQQPQPTALARRRALPFRSLRLGKDVAISVRGHEEPNTSRPTSSSSDILSEVTAAIEAAVVGRPITPPSPLKRRASQVPRPLTIRKSQVALLQHNTVEETNSKGVLQSPEQHVAPSVAIENRSVSSINLEGARTGDIVYPGPLDLSNKARGKLPVAKIALTWSSGAAPLPVSKNVKRQTLPRRKATKDSVPSGSRLPPDSAVSGPAACPSKLRAPTQSRAKDQAVRHPGHTVTRGQLLEAARRPSSVPTEAGSKPSRKLPRPKARREVASSVVAVVKPSSLPRKGEADISVATREPPAPASALAVFSGVAVNASPPASDIDSEQAQTAEVLSAPTASDAGTKASTFPRSRLPVSRRTVMPGTYPTSDPE